MSYCRDCCFEMQYLFLFYCKIIAFMPFEGYEFLIIAFENFVQCCFLSIASQSF